MRASPSGSTPQTPGPTATAPVAPAARFVHLCTGEIVELSAVTSVRVTAGAVLVLNGAEVVASYPRSEVYFVSDQPNQPPAHG